MKRYAISLALLFALGGCARTELVRNIEHIPVKTDKANPTVEGVEEAILRSGIALGWEMVKVKPGLIEGTLRRKQHVIRIMIPYTKTEYSLLYKDSENMRYSSGEIHKSYNVLVERLNGYIASVTGGAVAKPFSVAPFASAGKGQRQDNQGLEIEVEAVTDPARLKEFFGTSDLGKGILAIHARARSRNDSKSFIIQPESFRLGHLGSTAIERGSRGGEVMTGIGDVFILAVPLFPPAVLLYGGFVFAGLGTIADASMIQHALMVRGFKSATLSKGDSTEGFMYFRIPEQERQANKDLEVTVMEAGTGSQLGYRFNLTAQTP